MNRSRGSLPRGLAAGLAVAAGLLFLFGSRGGQAMAMTLESLAFSHNGDMPARLTCDGQDLSPPLSWSGLPAETRSLALIVD